MNNDRHDETRYAPFDTARLDTLLEDEGIDVLVATSKHNVQYLLGGYRFFFFDYMDAIGVSRYLPVVIYQKGRPDNSAYIGCHLESHEKQLGKFGLGSSRRPHATAPARSSGPSSISGVCPGRSARSASRRPSCPGTVPSCYRTGNNCQIVDAYFPWSGYAREKRKPNSRCCGRPPSVSWPQCSLCLNGCAPGQTKHELVDRLRREEVERGLTFEYCLMSAGKSFNRAPSDQRLEVSDIFSLDSGGNYKGYIGDLCRMGILGEPDAELVDLLGVIEEIEQRARRPIRRGAGGAEIFAAARSLWTLSSHRAYLDFVAHGMGLVSHEAPRLTDYKPWAYEGCDATRPLEADMVLSIETTMAHPKRGFIKLEDTIAVTEEGCVGFGDQGRGWSRPIGYGSSVALVE